MIDIMDNCSYQGANHIHVIQYNLEKNVLTQNGNQEKRGTLSLNSSWNTCVLLKAFWMHGKCAYPECARPLVEKQLVALRWHETCYWICMVGAIVVKIHQADFGALVPSAPVLWRPELGNCFEHHWNQVPMSWFCDDTEGFLVVEVVKCLPSVCPSGGSTQRRAAHQQRV